jgi:hypothetical protein
MTPEAGMSEFGAGGAWGVRPLYLDAKHRGGDADRPGHPAVPLGIVEKNDGQINGYRAEEGACFRTSSFTPRTEESDRRARDRGEREALYAS